MALWTFEMQVACGFMFDVSEMQSLTASGVPFLRLDGSELCWH